MQPNQQKNYWQNQTDTDEITHMYTPSPDTDEVLLDDTSVKADQPKHNTDSDPVHWSATEYIHQDKNALWFVIFAIIVVVFIAVDILLLKSYTFSALVVVMAISVVVYSRRPPRQIDYTLSGDQGLYVGEKLYHFSEFRAFGVIRDRQHNSIMLIPIKRFSPGVSVYFPEEVGEQIVDILGARLPMNILKLDMIDVIIRKLRL